LPVPIVLGVPIGGCFSLKIHQQSIQMDLTYNVPVRFKPPQNKPTSWYGSLKKYFDQHPKKYLLINCNQVLKTVFCSI
jgi:hypothetical protein